MNAMRPRHLLGKAEFDVAFASEAEAFEQHQDLGYLVRERLLAVIDEVFDEVMDELGGGSHVYRFDAIELDLGELPASHYQDAMEQRLRERLRAELLARLPARQSETAPGVSMISRQRADLEHFQHYLRNGCMTWNERRNAAIPLEQFARQVLRDSGAEFVGELKNTSAGELERIVLRLVAQFPDALLLDIATQLDPACSPRMRALTQALAARRPAAAQAREVRQHFWLALFDWLLENGGKPADDAHLLAGLLARMARRAGKPALAASSHSALARHAAREVAAKGVADVVADAAVSFEERFTRAVDALFAVATTEASASAQVVQPTRDMTAVSRLAPASGGKGALEHLLRPSPAVQVEQPSLDAAPSDNVTDIDLQPRPLPQTDVLLAGYDLLDDLRQGFKQGVAATLQAGVDLSAAVVVLAEAHPLLWAQLQREIRAGAFAGTDAADSLTLQALRALVQGQLASLESIGRDSRKARIEAVLHSAEQGGDTVEVYRRVLRLLMQGRSAGIDAGLDRIAMPASGLPVIRQAAAQQAATQSMAQSVSSSVSTSVSTSVSLWPLLARLPDSGQTRIRRLLQRAGERAERQLLEFMREEATLRADLAEAWIESFLSGLTPAAAAMHAQDERSVVLAAMLLGVRRDGASLERLLSDLPESVRASLRQVLRKAGASAAKALRRLSPELLMLAPTSPSDAALALFSALERDAWTWHARLQDPMKAPTGGHPSRDATPAGSADVRPAGQSQARDQVENENEADAAPESRLSALLAGHTEIGGAAAEAVARQVQALLAVPPARLEAWLASLRQDGAMLERLIATLPERMLTRIVYHLRGSEHCQIQTSADALAGACAFCDLGADPARLRGVKWRFILGSWLARADRFEQRAFVHHFADCLAEAAGWTDARGFRFLLSQQLRMNGVQIQRLGTSAMPIAEMRPSERGAAQQNSAELPPTSDDNDPRAAASQISADQARIRDREINLAVRRVLDQREGESGRARTLPAEGAPQPIDTTPIDTTPIDTTPVETKHPVRRPAAPEPLPESGEEIYIENAGLVLAAPYLPRLFGMLDLLADGVFRDAAAAERGVHLLQYLVDGSEGAPESALVLNKLLCGLPIAAPIEREVALQRREMDAAEGLLRGMIDNWKGIGRTSLQGLRETFLRREGMLQLRDEAWQLLVAPKPFDMLLDSLPWSIALIRLRWMQRVVHVAWR